MIETRFSLPANVFLTPSYVLTQQREEGPGLVHGKYATLGRVRKHSAHSKCKMELSTKLYLIWDFYKTFTLEVSKASYLGKFASFLIDEIFFTPYL